FDSGQLFGAAWDCNRKAKARRTQKASQRSDWQHQKKRKDLLQRRFAPGFQWPLCGSASLLRPTRRTFIARSFIVSAYILHPRVAQMAPGICTVAVKPLVSTTGAKRRLTAHMMATASGHSAQAILLSWQRGIGLPVDHERNIGRTGRRSGDFGFAPFTN